MSVEFTSPMGRIVGGHPMKRNPVTDKNGQPVMQPDGVTPATEAYIGLAIPKTPGVHWQQEPWGQQMVQAANAGFTNGEPQRADFAWKLTDGDSATPNKRNIAPNTREGYPGHWVLHLSTRLPVRSCHAGAYDPMQQIQDPNEIKPGDYGRVFVQAKANGSFDSPGVYLNPTLFSLDRPGELIVLDSGPSAAEAFGAATLAPVTPAPSPAPVTPAPSPAPVTPAVTPAPAPDFLNPPVTPAPTPAPAPAEQFHFQGAVYTRAALTASGWSDEQINGLPRA